MNPEPHLGRHLIQIYCHLLADSSTTSTQKHNRSGSWQRTAYEPWFGSQVGSSQREEPPADRNMVGQPQPPSDGRRDKRGNKRSKVKTRSVLKVKLPTLNKKVTKEEKTPRRWTLEPTINKSKPTASRGGAQCQACSSQDHLQGAGGEPASETETGRPQPGHLKLQGPTEVANNKRSRTGRGMNSDRPVIQLKCNLSYLIYCRIIFE
ncbi:uncharacterized protein LOC119007985 isoform X2 [Acanthopagrus latus]|uniref:uncharacterized protein LOC119007985 isoform X2 n=1 Tax=Acanthopagrus latus TaxID=8177 RepID=UPI00187CC9C4|nr:uncharacterized protein LOC119007985 isoform X2 [Acanthopagrus latus]